jgi:N6-L-threonylcarbamoyladenine synthase
VVPEVASRAHVEAINPMIDLVMQEADMRIAGVDAVAVTVGPGLVGALLVGIAAAKAVALALGVPFIGVNHLEGHIYANWLDHGPIDEPFVCFLVSGGHTMLVHVPEPFRYEVLGQTLDDAAGEAFDKIAKTLGLPYPGGPALEALAESGDPTKFVLPRMLLGRKDCDFSFSGLKTAAARIAETLTTEAERADLAACVQVAIAAQLAERSDRAMAAYAAAHEGRGLRFVVAGGVAANRAVRTRLQATAEARGFSFTAPPLAYCTDNAAMIALAGAERLALGISDPLDAPARPRWPLDEAAANANPTHVPGRKGAKA